MAKTILINGRYTDGVGGAVLADKVQIAIPIVTAAEHAAAAAIYGSESMTITDNTTSESWFQFKNTIFDFARSARYPFAHRPSTILDWWRMTDAGQWDKLLCWTAPATGNMFTTEAFYEAFAAGRLCFVPDDSEGFRLVLRRDVGGRAIATAVTPTGELGSIRIGHLTATSSAADNGGYLLYVLVDDNYEQPLDNIPGSATGPGVALIYHVNNSGDVWFDTVPQTSGAASKWFWQVTHQILDILPVDDPYAPKPEDPTSPPGSFEIPDTVQEFPDMPPSFADLGFMSIYRMTGEQARTLSATLWSGDILDRLKLKIANPMDVITSLHHLPFEVPTGGVVPICVGAINTQCPALKVNEQIVDVDFGPVTIKPFWGSYLDYSPHTRYQLYLPYIGSVDINPDDITGKELRIKYRVDVASGEAVVFVKCGNYIAYQHTCNMATAIPVTSGDGRTMEQKVLGALAPVASSTVGAIIGGPAGAFIGKTAGDIMSAKTAFTKFGQMSGQSGYMGYMAPFLYAIRPNIVNPARYAETKGYPCHETRAISDVSGFSIFEHPHVEDTGLTEEENRELMTLLESGVIL